MKVKLVCDNCGVEFETERTPKQLETYKHFFCTRECEMRFKSKPKEPNSICMVCGKPFRVKPYQVGVAKYCSKECHYKAKKEYMKGEKNHQYGLKGEKNASWCGGKRKSSYGYILINKPDHPFANGDGKVFEHRLIAEKYLLNDENSVVINGNKYLSKDYCIHHIDFNRTNNSPENLLVMKNDDHMSLHSTLRTSEKARKIYKLLTKCDVERIGSSGR